MMCFALACGVTAAIVVSGVLFRLFCIVSGLTLLYMFHPSMPYCMSP